MSKRSEIESLMESIQRNHDEIQNLPDEVDEVVIESDLIAVEQFIQNEISVTTKEISDRIQKKASSAVAGFSISAFLFLITFVSFQTNFIFAPYFAVVMVLLVIFSFSSLVGTKDLKAKVEKTAVETQSKYSDETKRSKAAKIAKMRVERANRRLQEKHSELTQVKSRLQQELQKLIT